MATHDYIIANADGATVRADINDALEAIVSNNSSTSEPATTYAYMWWADTTNGLLKLRNSADSAWITVGKIESSGNLTFEQEIKVNGSSSTGGAVTLYEDTDNGTNYVQLKAPASISSDLSLVLPSADGTSGQALTTDGSGNLSFADAGGGKVLQVVQASTTTQTSIASTSYQDTGITASITPTSATSKILITINAMYTIYRTGATVFASGQIVRDATSVQTFIDFARNNYNGVYSTFETSFSYLDSPNTTSSTTYKLQAKNDTTADSAEINFQAERNSAYKRSTITLMEIAA